MCDVYLMRDKADQSMASIKRMHGERKALVKLLQKHAPHMLEAMQPEHEDHLRAGRLYAAAGKQRAASKAFAKCEKLSPGHLAAAHTAVTSCPTKRTWTGCWRRSVQPETSSMPTVHSNCSPLHPRRRPRYGGRLAQACSIPTKPERHKLARSR